MTHLSVGSLLRRRLKVKEEQFLIPACELTTKTYTRFMREKSLSSRNINHSTLTHVPELRTLDLVIFPDRHTKWPRTHGAVEACNISRSYQIIRALQTTYEETLRISELQCLYTSYIQMISLNIIYKMYSGSLSKWLADLTSQLSHI